jgi:Cytotoxic
LPPIPHPSFLDEQESLGFVHGSRRWRSHDRSRLYEWDDRHQHIEVYDRRGYHLGVLNNEGILIGGAIKGRRIDV